MELERLHGLDEGRTPEGDDADGGVPEVGRHLGRGLRAKEGDVVQRPQSGEGQARRADEHESPIGERPGRRGEECLVEPLVESAHIDGDRAARWHASRRGGERRGAGEPAEGDSIRQVDNGLRAMAPRPGLEPGRRDCREVRPRGHVARVPDRDARHSGEVLQRVLDREDGNPRAERPREPEKQRALKHHDVRVRESLVGEDTFSGWDRERVGRAPGKLRVEQPGSVDGDECAGDVGEQVGSAPSPARTVLRPAPGRQFPPGRR